MRYGEVVEMVIDKKREPHQKPQNDVQNARGGKQEEQQIQRNADPQREPECDHQERPRNPSNEANKYRTEWFTRPNGIS
jgi:hypothetical protein